MSPGSDGARRKDGREAVDSRVQAAGGSALAAASPDAAAAVGSLAGGSTSAGEARTAGESTSAGEARIAGGSTAAGEFRTAGGTDVVWNAGDTDVARTAGDAGEYRTAKEKAASGPSASSESGRETPDRTDGAGLPLANRGPRGAASEVRDRYAGVRQFLKFNVVGALNTTVDFAAFTLLLALGVHYLIAQFVGYGCGIVNSYYWNRRWTFGGGREFDRGESAVKAAAGSGRLLPAEAAFARVPAASGRPHTGRHTGAAAFVRFVVLNAATLALSLALLELLSGRLGLHPFAGKIAATDFTVVVNYAGSRWWVFRA